MAETGRPSKYTPELANQICDLLIDGQSLRQICQRDDIPSRSTVLRWLQEHEDFQGQYARAKELGMELLADELLEIADDGSNDWMLSNKPNNPGYEFNGEAAQRSRIRIDARKWIMSKLAAKKYGDKLDIEHGGVVTVQAVNYADSSDTP